MLFPRAPPWLKVISFHPRVPSLSSSTKFTLRLPPHEMIFTLVSRFPGSIPFDSNTKKLRLCKSTGGVSCGDPTGNRTRVSAVRGLRLDRLTMGPSFQIALIIVVDSGRFVNKKRQKNTVPVKFGTVFYINTLSGSAHAPTRARAWNTRPTRAFCPSGTFHRRHPRAPRASAGLP